jgi:asparagine synthase (glutamine-hydrolysing)
MCGFFLTISKRAIDKKIWDKSFQSIKHRGPDNTKVKNLKCGDFYLKFGFHRLSISDSKNNRANQPFETSKSIIMFNGEIYNHEKLKSFLKSKSIRFSTNSDTETLIKYIEEIGINKSLKNLDGMWSFAIFSKEKKKFYFSRDRYGEKPFYYYHDQNMFVVASEIKSILIILNKKNIINDNVLKIYLDKGIINFNNETFYKDIQQLEPSHLAELILGKTKIFFKKRQYHTFNNLSKNQSFSFSKNKKNIYRYLFNSSKLRISNEVKNALLLSGGLDSSVLAAVYKQIGLDKVKELYYAKSNNNNSIDNEHIDILTKGLNLNIKKIKILSKSKNFFSLMKKLTWYNDQPLLNLSNISQFEIGKQLRKKNIKVIISGQGADEIFYGYSKYVIFYMINLLKKGQIFKLIKIFFFYLINNSLIYSFKDKKYLKYSNKLNTYNNKLPNLKNFSNLKYRSYLDLVKYSVPTLCHSEDRMYMASGIEVRLPYLSNDLVNEVVNIPDDLKLHKGISKYMLRKSFEKKIHKEIIQRTKKEGFDLGIQDFFIRNIDYIKNFYINKNSFILKKKIISNDLIYDFENLNINEIFKKYNYSFIFRLLCTEVWFKRFKQYLKN